MKRLTALLLLFVLALASRAYGADLPQPDPQKFLDGVMHYGRLKSSSGEQFCWYAAYSANQFLNAYEAFDNPEWLETAETFYAYLIERLETDPDGYEGWIGDPIGQTGSELLTDAVVGDAIICEALTRFALIVKDSATLQARFGKTADEYVRLSTRICWEKWNRRGCYYEDAEGWGSYRTYGKLIDPVKNEWVDRPGRVISNNLNKHYSVGKVILRLWRLTGKPEYKERVKRVFGRAKSMWRYYPEEDRVVWNFWMPHGAYDIEGRAPRSWVGVHPSRSGYQAGEVSDWVEVYDSGLVFSKQDLERIIRTNHWMMPGGEQKGWRCADGTSKAGQLWTALARFDERILAEAHKRVDGKADDRSRVEAAYLKNVVDKRVGWTRLHMKAGQKVELVDPPLQPGRNIAMSVPLPDRIAVAAGQRSKLACQTRVGGTLAIDLLSEDGEELGRLHTIEVADKSVYNAPLWDGTLAGGDHVAPGRYLVRWSLAGESRSAPVTVIRGNAAVTVGPKPLAKGETIETDFEGDLDKRWELNQAQVSSEQAHGGTKSLRVDGSARLILGDTADLPVRIAMWVRDAGTNLGRRTGNGPAWGVQTAMGDKFALRMVWRKYLNGDRDYAWLNTGENQWFTPHPSKVGRKAGWSKWVFDFRDASDVSVSRDGAFVQQLSPRFTPTGAVAVYLLGSQQGGPLYVDDVTVEY